MDKEKAPERKAKIVVVTKSKMTEKYRKRRNKISKKKAEERILKKAQAEKRIFLKTKEPIKELYEYLTNTITEDREAQISRRRLKRRGARNPNEQRLMELDRNLENFWDPFLDPKDVFEIRKNYEDLSVGLNT